MVYPCILGSLQASQINQYSVCRPREWEPQNGVVELKSVERSSETWTAISDRFQQNLAAEIVQIERIQNEWLWERYVFAKQRMIAKNRGEVNEMELLHGTSSTSPAEVYKSEFGFDFRYCRSKRLFGTGCYFAESASYSDAYAHKTFDQLRQVLVAKVLTGSSWTTSTIDHALMLPPPKPPSSSTLNFISEHYDTVRSYVKNSFIYVVYDHEKAYPAYLVSYRLVT